MNPDNKLAERNKIPRARILNSKLSIASNEGNEAIIPVGWLVCNFFSCSLSIIDWAADRHNIL